VKGAIAKGNKIGYPVLPQPMIIEVSFEEEKKQRRELPRKGGGGAGSKNTESSDPFALSPLKTPK